MNNTDSIIVIVLITIDLTGALIYSCFDPKRYHITNEHLYEADDYRIKEKATFWDLLLSWIINSLLVFTWLIGLININNLKRKGMYFGLLKDDSKYLIRSVDTYLFSEVEKMSDEDISKQIAEFERLLNKYEVPMSWIDRDDPYDVQYLNESKELFKRRIKLKLK